MYCSKMSNWDQNAQILNIHQRVFITAVIVKAQVDCILKVFPLFSAVFSENPAFLA